MASPGVQTGSRHGGPTVPAWLAGRLAGYERVYDLEPFPFLQSGSPELALDANDCLRLAAHPAVLDARRRAAGDARAARRSQAASVFYLEPQVQALADELRSLLACEEVILTGSGWNANVGLIAALASPETTVYADRHAHASMLDGARMAGAPIRVFEHHDIDDLRRLIDAGGPGVVCVDALYSTDGSLLDLAGFTEICEQTGCVLVLDEAHSVGVIGPRGGGLAVREPLESHVLLRTGSLSKALGGPGGFIATTRAAARAIRAGFRPGIFSSAPSPLLAAGHRAALKVAAEERWRAERVRQLGRHLSDLLARDGAPVVPSETHLVSLWFHGADACEIHATLRAAGIGTSVFVHPAAPKGMSVLRFALHCELSDDDVGQVATLTARSTRRLTCARV